MSLIVTQFSDWNEKQFQAFIEFKRELQGDLETYFPETIDEYKKLLHQDSPFAKDYEWRAFLVHDDQRLVGKAILAWRKDTRVGNLGFIDWVKDEEVASLLTSEVEAFARTKGLNQIKTPIDLNFFVKYRMKCKGGGPAYFGEPIYPDYYHDLFEKTGYGVVGTWDTYKIKRLGSFTTYWKKRKTMKKRNHAHIENVKIRFLRISEWDSELRIVYDLFVKSFKEMKEFEPISFEQFKLVYDDFKYIVHPLFSYIAELDDVPIAFSINYPDPLALLSKVKHKKLSALDKIVLLVKLRLNFKTLLIPYMGKIPGPKGEDVKGIFIKFSKLIGRAVVVANTSLVCYQSEDSPSRRPLDPSITTHYAKYVLYGKDLS